MKVALALTLFALPLLAQEPVRYQLRFPNAAHHEAEIRATFSGIRGNTLELVMSSSSPGRYAVHDFAKNVYNVRATDGKGKALDVVKTSASRWTVSGAQGAAVVDYTLYGDRADGTYAGIDSTHAHLNMPATILWAKGFEKSAYALKFDVPEGSGWTPATQLVPAADGWYTAPFLDRLMDGITELSKHDWNMWKVGDAEFRLSLHHRGTPEEAAAYAKMAEAVVIEEEGIFGALPKYDNGTYTFLIDYLPYVNGDGMEHRDSTSITGTRDLHDAASQSIGTVAHEFFHNWNVKRIRPATLEPFDYERANMSGELWFAEGFTQYYGPLALKRAGMTDLDRYVRSAGASVNAILTAPGRQIHNVVEMSRLAPFVDAATANDPVNFQNTFISYYTYGAAIALGVDLEIRTHFHGKSLDDWMRQMWKEHPDVNKPYTLADLESSLGTAVGDKNFAHDIFTRHIYGKEPMPYADLLAHAGLSLDKRSAGIASMGNQAYAFTETGAEITGATLRDSPLYIAGLDRGDRLTQVDGKTPASQQVIAAVLRAHKPGDKIRVRYEGRSGRKEAEVTLAEAPQVELTPYELTDKALTPAMLAFREAWLGNKAIRPLPKLVKYCPVCRRQWQFDYERCPSDGGNLQITPPKPGDADAEPPAAPAAGGRGGRGGRGGGQ